MKKRYRIPAAALAALMALMMAACGQKEYTVRFDAGKGEIISGKISQTVIAGESAEAPAVEREGYALSGWDTDFSNVQSNLEVCAMWVRLYSVTFDPDGGSIASGKAEQSIAKGETPTAPTVTREGYTFLGWDKDVSPASGDAVYTALWEAKSLSAKEVYARSSGSMVEIAVYDQNGSLYSLGSGFFIDEKGTIITNYHVMEGAYSAKASLYNGETYDITGVIDYSQELDMAAVTCGIPASMPLIVSDREISSGDTIYTLGSSLGETDTFTNGIVSNPDRVVNGEKFIQITAPISHGNSGGPLINEFGEVIGINSWTYTDGQNMNYAINICELKNLDLDRQPQSMEAFYNATYTPAAFTDTNYTIVTTGNEGEAVYELADFIEWEDNGTVEMADVLVNDCWTAAYVDVEDLDIFSVTIDETTEVTYSLFNYWGEDDEYVTAVLINENYEPIYDLNDQLCLISDVLTEDGYFLKTLTLTPGTYYLCVFLPEDYPYADGAYYLVGAYW